MTEVDVRTATITPQVRRLAGAPDPLALYGALSDHGRLPNTFLLESADRDTHTGETSLVGASAALRFRATLTEATITGLSPNGRSALEWLAAVIPQASADAEDATLTIPLPGPPADVDEAIRYRRTAVFDLIRTLAFGPALTAKPNVWCHLTAGVFGYDAIDYVEALPLGKPDPLDQPIIELLIPDQLIVIDHLRQSTVVITTAWSGPNGARHFHDATRALEKLVGLVSAARPASRAPATRPGALDQAAVDQSDAEYQAVVGRLQEHLRAGDAYQIVPSRTFSLPCSEPLAAYANLRVRNPSPYLFYFAFEGRTLLGASPETCLRVDGATRLATILPIAGTVPRGRRPDGTVDADADTRNEVTLRLDQKEMAEHLMLVDLARNDLARISVPGTRQVARLLTVERYAHVMHLVSEVSGTLAPGVDALEAYAATMNMGTLVGAPKVKAAELLRRHEPSRRGAYGGGVGYLRHDGTLETAIVIRSAVVANGVGQVRAGAGVVLDSDPAREALETRHKARAVLDALAAASTPEDGAQ